MDEQTTPQEIDNSTFAGVSNGAESVKEIKRKIGRPLKFQTVEELQEKIDKYFELTPKDEWTITGLAMALDTFRKVLCEYEERDEFSNAIKKAKQQVENGYEIDLKKAGRSGTIFALKNFDWKDESKQYQEHSGNLGIITLPQKNELETSEETNRSLSKTRE